MKNILEDSYKRIKPIRNRTHYSLRFQRQCYINKPGLAQVGAISKLKNSKRTSKCQSIGEFGTFYEKQFLKSLTMPKKLKGRTLWDFPTSILLQNYKK